MKPEQSAPSTSLMWIAAAGCALLWTAHASAQSQLAPPGQSSPRPQSTATTPIRMGAPVNALAAPASGAPAAATSPAPNGNPFSVRVLTQSESASPASKAQVAKAQFMELAKQTGANPTKSDGAIANLQAGDSVKLSLLTPRQGWASLFVERPDRIDFDAGDLQFDAVITKFDGFPGHPACKFTAPTEGYYMVDVLIENAMPQQITTWTTPHLAADSRGQIVQQQVKGGINHILVSIQARKDPAYSMMQTVQFFGGGKYTFKSCEITRLK